MKQMMIICVLAVAGLAGQSAGIITDVYVIPTDPMAWDDISIVTSGFEGSGPVSITGTDFRIDGTSLELDLFLSVGPYTVITPWSHIEDIGVLPIGSYNLTVNTFEMSQISDSYPTTFVVVPEPVTAMLLGTGFLGMLVNRRRR